MASNAENVSIWWRHHDHISLIHRYCMIACVGMPYILMLCVWWWCGWSRELKWFWQLQWSTMILFHHHVAPIKENTFHAPCKIRVLYIWVRENKTLVYIQTFITNHTPMYSLTNTRQKAKHIFNILRNSHVNLWHISSSLDTITNPVNWRHQCKMISKPSGCV